MLPECGTSIAPMRWRRVDFPDPDGPETATTWLRGMLKDTASRATIVSEPAVWFLVTRSSTTSNPEPVFGWIIVSISRLLAGKDGRGRGSVRKTTGDH